MRNEPTFLRSPFPPSLLPLFFPQVLRESRKKRLIDNTFGNFGTGNQLLCTASGNGAQWKTSGAEREIFT